MKSTILSLWKTKNTDLSKRDPCSARLLIIRSYALYTEYVNVMGGKCASKL